MYEIPACMTWPTPPVGDQDELAMRLWQDGRCGLCGRHVPEERHGGLVLDHDHTTHLIRGYVCRRCNNLEPHSRHAAFAYWRSGWNPAQLMGVFEEYSSPFEQGRRILADLWPEPTQDELQESVNLLTA